MTGSSKEDRDHTRNDIAMKCSTASGIKRLGHVRRECSTGLHKERHGELMIHMEGEGYARNDRDM